MNILFGCERYLNVSYVVIGCRLDGKLKEFRGERMKALIVEHDHVSPPGYVAECLISRGFEITEVLVVTHENFKTPNVNFIFPDPVAFDLIVILGAPWGVWDQDNIGNWVVNEISWLKGILESNKPVLGICFGGQLIAKAMGGDVAPAPKCEIGWQVVLSDDQSIISNGPWFQFHYDRWELPPKALEIARNPAASQAFIINNSLAVQFHPEISSHTLEGWLKWGGDIKVLEDGQDPLIMMTQTSAYEEQSRNQTFALVNAFLTNIAKLV